VGRRRRNAAFLQQREERLELARQQRAEAEVAELRAGPAIPPGSRTLLSQLEARRQRSHPGSPGSSGTTVADAVLAALSPDNLGSPDGRADLVHRRPQQQQQQQTEAELSTGDDSLFDCPSFGDSTEVSQVSAHSFQSAVGFQEPGTPAAAAAAAAAPSPMEGGRSPGLPAADDVAALRAEISAMKARIFSSPFRSPGPSPAEAEPPSPRRATPSPHEYEAAGARAGVVIVEEPEPEDGREEEEGGREEEDGREEGEEDWREEGEGALGPALVDFNARVGPADFPRFAPDPGDWEATDPAGPPASTVYEFSESRAPASSGTAVSASPDAAGRSVEIEDDDGRVVIVTGSRLHRQLSTIESVGGSEADSASVVSVDISRVASADLHTSISSVASRDCSVGGAPSSAPPSPQVLAWRKHWGGGADAKVDRATLLRRVAVTFGARVAEMLADSGACPRAARMPAARGRAAG
jgi:hypothetical protein